MGRELFSIMPEYSLAQKESDLGLRSILNLPRLCEFSNKAVEVLIIFDQPVEDEGVDITGGRILSKNGIEKRGIPDRADDELVDPWVGLIAFIDQGDQQQNEKKEREGEKESLDLQGIFPFERDI